MDKDYLFHCRGCKKPDKEYPNRFDDYEYGGYLNGRTA